jgi:GNAT superfamily N-acetyltransferase
MKQCDRPFDLFSPHLRSVMAALPAPAATAPALRIRPLGPPDAPLLDAVFGRMSEQSRYTRFHGPKPRLTGSDRAYLAGADGRDHIAFVALDASGVPLGIARGVRLIGEPEVAEIAAEVIDAHQREGVGTALVARLARRAAAVGVARLRASVLAQTGLAAVLGRRGWRATGGDGLTVTLGADVWALARAGDPAPTAT